MPKIKTHKATAKRFRVTKGKKVVQRTSGQGHFNGKQTGKKRRSKRNDHSIGCDSLAKTIKTLINQR